MRPQKALWEEFCDFSPVTRHVIVAVGFFVCLAGAGFFWWSVWFGCLSIDVMATVMKSME